MRQLKIEKQAMARESDSLIKYLKEIGREELISAEEEVNLARKIKQGDTKSAEKLIKANLRFVVSVAKQYQNRGLPLSDLINEGNIGLIKAAKRFDETRGFKLISYAVWWIRQSIMLALKEQRSQVRVPSNKIDMINRVNNVSMKLEQQFQREPSYEEIGNELSLSVEVINDVMNTSRRQVSIDAPLAEDLAFTLMDVMEDKDQENIEQEIINNSLKKDIERAISTLPSTQASVLRLYFGLNDKEPMTLEEIGDQFGFVRDKVRQIKEKAIFNLKHTSSCKNLKEYLS